MGMPVKISDELVRQAREEAKAADRSITAQIEHWAKLGRSVERALRHDDAIALKQTDGDIEKAFPAPVTRESILALLRGIAAETDRSDLARELMAGRTVYQIDPAGSDAIEQIAADGTRTLGHFEDGRFVPESRGR